ncbi:hypothetical protein BLNAU_23626 [Blattamonas nauphoetae]|uniref:Secreted protein n=1 Tax=Blattamonas nauphoetae TaxID=2049346 RepID=A0ABQ9WPQ4_9EUKA|nr:hypothetical protein BLNAU_23626 [Blattamonas nauphoetae]
MILGIMFSSTLNHTQALISTSINTVCARTNPSEKYRVTVLAESKRLSFPVLVICITPHRTCYDCDCPARRSQENTDE